MGIDGIWEIVALLVGPTGAAWAGVKYSLNGLGKRIERIEDHTSDTHEAVHRLANGQAVLATRLEEHGRRISGLEARTE